MPIYDYECQSCGSRVEALRPVSGRHDVPDCPKCGGPTRLVVGGRPSIDVPFRPGYYPCIARYPGDPLAYVDTKRRLFDRAARIGVKLWRDPPF